MTGGKRIFGAFAVAIALFFFWPVIIGGWQKVGALKAAVAEREQLLADRTRIIANVKTAYAEYQTKLTQTDGQKFAAIVPVHKDNAEVVSALQEIATQAGAQLNEISTVDARRGEDEQFQKLSLVMELVGTYPAMRQFLTGLEQYVRLLNVSAIEVNVDANDTSSLRFLINADAYFIQ